MLCSSSDKRESAVSAMASSRPPPIQPLKERGLGLTVPSTGRDRLFIDLTGGPAPDAEGAWGRLPATGPTSALKCRLGQILARPLSHPARFATARGPRRYYSSRASHRSASRRENRVHAARRCAKRVTSGADKGYD